MAPRAAIDIEGTSNRLRIARNGQGLSTRKVAELLREKSIAISHGTLANYERGLTDPSENTLSALAGIYGKTTEWLRGAGNALSGIRYRALKSVTVKNKSLYTNESHAWLELYSYLESLLNKPLAGRGSLPEHLTRSLSGEQLASHLRQSYQLGNHPVPSVIKILEDFGVRVIHIKSDERIDAFAARMGNSPVVVLNSSLCPDRMRLTALHELAHHIYEDCLSGTSLTHEDIEKRAFEFASLFLMPPDVLREALEYKSMVRLVDYKERFGISLAAMIYRARIGHLISQSTYHRLWKQFSKLGFRTNEPGKVAPDRSLRLESLIDAAVVRRKMSFRDVADRVNTDEQTIRNRLLTAMGGREIEDTEAHQPGVINLKSFKDEQHLI